ncbi:monovalent cation/H(+) antiporter subunit G [Peptococcaceae bacterium]|nr:monovalent cation/H(+) antiporter subunit G [Peptococcaceae bacterium]
MNIHVEPLSEQDMKPVFDNPEQLDFGTVFTDRMFTMKYNTERGMHALGKCDTFGILLCLIGIMIYEGFSLNSLKLFYIWVFIALANPTATKIISRSAYYRGIKPWVREDTQNQTKEG